MSAGADAVAETSLVLPAMLHAFQIARMSKARTRILALSQREPCAYSDPVDKHCERRTGSCVLSACPYFGDNAN